jgi:sugar phosphate isomerase/epimerase
MVGISTALITKRGNAKAEEIFEFCERCGIRQLELDVRVSRDLLREMIPKLKKGEFKAVSLHNFCPLPDNILPHKASADAFNLASLDLEERREGVKWSLKTIETACELEAQVVILHLGFISDFGEDPRRFLEDNFKGKPLSEFLKWREEKVKKHLDALFRALEVLLKRAEILGINIGMENRYYPHEIPLNEEIGLILEEFEGAPLFYWHDTGHAHVLEKLGVSDQKKLLRIYGSKMLGLHLHDADGFKDHLAPGKGEINFEELKELLPQNAIRILEIHPPCEEDELKEAINLLRRNGLV